MMRLLGVLVGSALAVAALVVFVGIPEFTTESNVVEDTVITLPMRAGSASPEPEPELMPQADREVAVDSPAQPPESMAAEPGPEIETGFETEAEAEPAVAPAESPPAEAVTAPRWYAFWSPFRSEIAANGFVDQLQRVTGLDYRVVKVKPGVYEVAFAYAEDGEITANLSQISAATGLQLPES